MNIHEYQAKMILVNYGIKIPDFIVIGDHKEAKRAIAKLKLHHGGVVKAQIHAGGRGKAGGVKIGKSEEELLEKINQLLDAKIITKQTGKEGIVVKEVLLSPLISIEKEFYVACVINREISQAVFIISPVGGVDIEEVSEKDPHLIKTIPFSFPGSLKEYQLIEMCKFMNWEKDVARQGKKLFKALANAFFEIDASLIEINPLVLTKESELVALDAKISIDDNALFRQKYLLDFFDPSQINANEAKAKEYDLAYIALEGEIGCMVNGAGLAMATMDIIHHYGGTPANFLDVGGSATEEKVAEGFKIILSDPNVKAILVNIFGGIMNCVTLAAGIIAANNELKVHVPLVVRMEGTNVEKGKKILEDSGLDIIIADDLNDAAKKIVMAAKGK